MSGQLGSLTKLDRSTSDCRFPFTFVCVSVCVCVCHMMVTKYSDAHGVLR